MLVSPVYAVMTGFIALSINSLSNVRFKIIDGFIVTYIIIIGFFYLQIDEIPVIKETLVYVVGPFLFYFLGKSMLNSRIDKTKLYVFITYIFVIYSCYIFFVDANGNPSFDLRDNYYYNSRNKLLDKSKLVHTFMNETNLSLLVLTDIFLVLFVIRKKIFKISLVALLLVILLVLASRSAVATLAIMVFIYIYKYESLKNKLIIFFFGCLTIVTLTLIIDVFEIPYINTFFKRTLEKSFGESASSFGFEGRFLHYNRAILNSRAFFDVKGYLNLLRTYQFSSHNEVLGHTSSSGIIPTITYFSLIVVLAKNRLKTLKRTKTVVFEKKILLVLVISYFIVGLTENIYISNVVWMYLFLFTIGITTVPKSNHDKEPNYSHS